MSVAPSPAFGTLLKRLRKRAGMSQRDLAAALDYSDSLISSLENGQRRPDLDAVIHQFIPTLGLQDEPGLAALLVEHAAAARGESPPPPWLPQVAGTRRDAGRPARHSSVPALPVELIGRSDEVHQIGSRLLEYRSRLLTLVGPPGVGKTTLALAVCAQVQVHYRDGAIFVPLAAVGDDVQMAAALIDALAPGDAVAKPPQKRLVELLRQRSMLLALVNLEQIDGAAPLIATLLAECPGLTILATSRERLHLRAEQRFMVQPLRLTAAVTLFAQRAQAVDPSFRLTAENRATVTAICSRLDCLPLALELCAGQIEIFSLSQLLDQLSEHRLDLLVDGAYDAPVQHRSLRAAIQCSYTSLSAAEQTLLRQLGVFAGGFDQAAVEAMGAVASGGTGALHSPLSALRALVGKSLVYTETGPSGDHRFALLETIREFALERLRQEDEEEFTRRRHYAICLERFRAADPHLRGPEAVAWFARLQPEHDNLRAAIRWTLGQARYAEAALLLVVTGWYWRLRGHWYEELAWLQSILPHRSLLEPRLQLAFFVALFSVARASEDSDMARRYAEELRELMQFCPDKLLHAGIWHFMALATADSGEAKTAWIQSLAMARAAAESPRWETEFGVSSDCLFILSAVADNYAVHLIEHGELSQATALIHESLKACEERGFRSGIAACYGNLGRVWLLQGDLAQAYPYLRQAGLTAAATIHPAVLAKILPFLALATLYQNDATEARRLLSESLDIWTQIRDKVYLARVCIYLAETALWEGKIEETEQWLSQSLAYQVDPRRIGIATVNCLLVAARLAVARQAYARAAMLFGLAEETRVRAHCTLVEPVRAQVNAALAVVQAALGPDACATAFAAGPRMVLEAAPLLPIPGRNINV